MSELIFRNDEFELWEQDGIVFYKYFPGLYINYNIATTLVTKRIELCGENPKAILVDARNLKGIDKKAREFLSGSDAQKYVTAGAIIINNHIQKLLANAFLKLYWRGTPAKIFTEYNKAIIWLDYFKSVN